MCIYLQNHGDAVMVIYWEHFVEIDKQIPLLRVKLPMNLKASC